MGCGVILVTQLDMDLSSYPLDGVGYASTLHVEPQDDPVAKLRVVVAEVTGKPCDPPPKNPIGFLP